MSRTRFQVLNVKNRYQQSLQALYPAILESSDATLHETAISNADQRNLFTPPRPIST